MMTAALWPYWGSGVFLAALVAVAGPIIIHLLNRRRQRTIRWGPMEFLKQVMKRHRRILRLRDVLLLVLRTAIVLLFVLAMAQPYWSDRQGGGAAGRPMHGVLVIDNSLSMGYTPIDKSLLDLAKDKSARFIEALPEGSKVSVIPLCSYSSARNQDAYATKEDALEAVNRIELADRSTPITDGFTEARAACARLPNIPTKRVVFIGDSQRRTWSLDGAETYLAGLSDIQIVQLGPPERTNTWVADFRLLHGIADTDSKALFRAVVRHEGQPRQNVRVSLLVGDAPPQDFTVNLADGDEIRLDFEHKFRKKPALAGATGGPWLVPATLKLSADDVDRLAMDDYRTLIVPVVARIPVVFIDQYGAHERPREGKIGETERVRRLLRTHRSIDPQTGKVTGPILRTIDEVTDKDLQDARLVVIAGVPSPPPGAVAMLRKYVERGGSIFIGAGGAFDAAEWTKVAWRDGAGILPAPLKDEPVGRIPLPNEKDPASFKLDKTSISGRALYLDMTPEETDAILGMPRFYKAVVADMALAKEKIPAGAARPLVLGRYDNKNPFVVQRDIGKGRVIMLTSGLGRQPVWNTLPLNYSVLLVNRIMRSLLVRTLPDLTFGPEREIEIPVAGADQTTEFTVQAPGATPHPQKADSLGPQSFGLLLKSLQRRGVYRIRRIDPVGTGQDTTQGEPWSMVLAVNGPARESELAYNSESDIPDRIGSTDIRRVGPDEEISLEGMTYFGYDFWWILMILTLACILLEMALLTSWRLASLKRIARSHHQAAADAAAQSDGLPRNTRIAQ